MTKKVTDAHQEIIDTLAEARTFVDDVVAEQPDSLVSVCVNISVLDLKTGAGRRFEQVYGSYLLSLLELRRLLVQTEGHQPDLTKKLNDLLGDELKIQDIVGAVH